MSSMRSITTDGAYYRKVFQLFCQKCRKTEVDRKWAEQIFPQVVLDKLPPQSNGTGTPFRSLGLGSGTGELETSLLRQVSKRYQNIRHTVVEPAKAFIEKYQSLLSNENDLKDIHFNWKEQTMQDFQNETERREAGASNKFHFISTVHSIYYADDKTDTIRFLQERLEDSGVLMISVTTDDSSNTKFCSRFPVILGQNPHTSLFNSADVERSLGTLKLPYDVHTQPSAADISAIFDASSSEGNSLLDFLTHTIDFRGTAPAHLREDIVTYLKSPECSQIGNDGSVMFLNPWKTFIIQKV